MTNDSETVREVCAEMKELELVSNDGRFPFDRVKRIFANASDRIFSANEREMAAKDAEIARLKAELNAKKNRISGLVTDVQNKNGHICDKQFETLRLEKRIALLERALKPVMNCHISTEPFETHGMILRFNEKEVGLNALDAVREAQRIMKEGEAK